MPKGGCFINLARGQHVVEAELMAALDSGQLEAATLDVFRQEPLPKEDPLWAHPRITIMPHVARMPAPRDIVPQIVENVRRAQAGRPLEWVVDLRAGY
jgi:glyoxylate/hydroxypyruvate reductase A